MSKQQEQKEQEDLDRAILSSILEMSLKDSSLKSASITNVTRVYSSVDVKRPEAKLSNNLNGGPSNQIEKQQDDFLNKIASLLDEIEKIKESKTNTKEYRDNRVKEKNSQIQVLQARLTSLERQHSNSNSNSNSKSNTNIRNSDSERRKILDRIRILDVRLLVESDEFVKQEIFDEIEVLRLVLDSM
jgi:hypothetical protein